MRFKLEFLLIPILLISCIPISTMGSNFSNNGSIIDLHDLCTTQSCTTAAKKIAKRMDPTVKPCENFYQFTCGGAYLNSADSDDEPSSKTGLYLSDNVYKKIDKQLISSLEREIYVNDTEPEKIVKYLYQTCVNTSAIDKQGLSPFLDIIEQVGGWPVLKENKKWNETAFNWNRVNLKIGNENYWINKLIEIKLNRDPSNEKEFYLSVKKPRFTISEAFLIHGRTNDNAKNYFNYMVNVAVSMGANETYAKKELNYSLEFEIKLASIKPPDNVKNAYAVMFDQINGKNTTLSDLMEIYSFIPWREYINYILFSNNNVTLGDVKNKIEIYNLKYFNGLQDLIASTPKKILANYIIWKYIDDVAYHLNNNTRKMKIAYDNVINNEGPTSRPTKCLEFLQLKMPQVLNALYVRDHFDENKEDNVRIIFNNVHNEFVRSLNKTKWLDDETKNRIIEKIKNMSLIIGYPKELRDDYLTTNKFIQHLKLINDSYVANIYNAMIYSEKSKLKRLISVSADKFKRLNAYEEFFKSVVAYYFPDDNFVYTSAGILQNPIYRDDSPLFMNYGILGFLVGHEIGHVFNKDILRKDKFGKFYDWPNATYHEKTECFLNQYLPFQNSKRNRTQKTGDEDIADNNGIRAAYQAYKKLSNTDKSLKLKNKIYSPQQMFWISAASFWCEEPNYKHKKNHSPSNLRINIPFSNIKAFADDFNCSKSSEMNPVKKCRLW